MVTRFLAAKTLKRMEVAEASRKVSTSMGVKAWRTLQIMRKWRVIRCSMVKETSHTLRTRAGMRMTRVNQSI